MNKILSFNFTNMTAGISDPFECKKKLTYILIFSIELDNSSVVLKKLSISYPRA